MSALPPKADIRSAKTNVRFVPIADMVASSATCTLGSDSQLAYSFDVRAAIQISTIPAASGIQFWNVIPTTV